MPKLDKKYAFKKEVRPNRFSRVIVRPVGTRIVLLLPDGRWLHGRFDNADEVYGLAIADTEKGAKEAAKKMMADQRKHGAPPLQTVA